MEELINTFTQYTQGARVFALLRALSLIIIGFILAKIVSSALLRIFRKRLDLQQQMVLQRGAYYLIIVLFGVSALREMGFDLGVLLGAAGILTVALGFASQTSASNLISGIFLIAERPFAMGDIIKVGNTTGEVLSINLLSIQLRTFDNVFVRVPNETVMKSEITNLSRFPIRRIDIMLHIAYKSDIALVREILFEVAEKNLLCLEEPKPLFIFQRIREGALDLQFSVWAPRDTYLDVKNSLQIDIKNALEAHQIEFPMTCVTLAPLPEPAKK